MAAKPVASAAAVAEEEELVSVVWCTTLGIPEDVAIKLVNQKWRVAGLTKDESKFEKVLAGVGCLAGDIDAAWRKWQAASSRSPAQPSATFMAIPTLQRENERGFHFVNRDNELDTMEKWLTANGNDAHIEKSHSTPWHFVIAAQSLGTGKTALGAAFVDHMASANINICYIYINFERVIPSTPAPLATEESFKVFICTQVLGACISQLAPDGERDSKRAQWAGLSSSTPLLPIIAQFRPSASPLFVHFDEVDFLWEHKIKDRPLFYYLADYLCASLGGEHSLCYFSGRRTELFRVGRHMNGLAAHAATPYSSTQWHAEQLILSTLQPDHIRELLMRNKLTPSDQLVTQILAETGGVARLVGFALKHLLKDPTATVLIPAAFAQYVHEISSKDVQHALKPIFLRIAEWAIWGLPVRLDSPCDPAMLAKEKLGPMSVRELAEQFSLHTTKHEWFDDQVRIVVPLVLVRAAMIDLKGSIDSPVLSAVFLHYQASMGNVDDPATMILCRGGVSREQARETCGARVFLRLFFLAREDTALQHLCSVFASSYAGNLVVKRPLGQLCFMPKVVAGVKARAQMTEQQRKAATDRIARLMKKELSLLNADEAPAINFADWNHYLRPTPPLQGAFIAIDRSSSPDVLILPHDTIQLQSGTEDPSGAGPLKCNTEFSCEIALQLKGNDDLTPLLIQQESAKIPAPTLDSKRILTLLIIGGGKLKDLAGVPVGSGEAIVAHYFGPRRPITTQADAYTIPAYMEVIVLTARGIACLFTHDLSTLLWPSLILSPDEIDPKVPTASGSAHTNAPAKRRQSAPAPTSLSPGPSDEGKRPAPKRGKGRGK